MGKDAMDEAKALYDEDFLLWTRSQAEALRAAARGRSNRPLDWENLAEEIEDLGNSTRRELASRLLVLIEHLLKLEHSPALAPRAGWKETIDRERAAIEDLLEQSPSLKNEAPRLIEKARARAARTAGLSLARRGEARARISPPDYRIEEILGDWFPEPPSSPGDRRSRGGQPA